MAVFHNTHSVHTKPYHHKSHLRYSLVSLISVGNALKTGPEEKLSAYEERKQHSTIGQQRTKGHWIENRCNERFFRCVAFFLDQVCWRPLTWKLCVYVCDSSVCYSAVLSRLRDMLTKIVSAPFLLEGASDCVLLVLWLCSTVRDKETNSSSQR